MREMTYGDWLKEGEDVLWAMPTPTEAEDAALSLELARENAEQAREEEAEMDSAQRMHDDDTGEVVTVAPENVHPIGLVAPSADGEFVELDEGVFVRAAAVQYVAAMEPFREAGGAKTYLCNVVTDTGNWSVYPVRTVLAALTLALENGRARRVERAEY